MNGDEKAPETPEILRRMGLRADELKQEADAATFRWQFAENEYRQAYERWYAAVGGPIREK